MAFPSENLPIFMHLSLQGILHLQCLIGRLSKNTSQMNSKSDVCQVLSLNINSKLRLAHFVHHLFKLWSSQVILASQTNIVAVAIFHIGENWVFQSTMTSTQMSTQLDGARLLNAQK